MISQMLLQNAKSWNKIFKKPEFWKQPGNTTKYQTTYWFWYKIFSPRCFWDTVFNSKPVLYLTRANVVRRGRGNSNPGCFTPVSWWKLSPHNLPLRDASSRPSSLKTQRSNHCATGPLPGKNLPSYSLSLWAGCKGLGVWPGFGLGFRMPLVKSATLPHLSPLQIAQMHTIHNEECSKNLRGPRPIIMEICLHLQIFEF